MLSSFPKPIRKYRLIMVGSGVVAFIAACAAMLTTYLLVGKLPDISWLWPFSCGLMGVQMTGIFVGAWQGGRYLRSVGRQFGCVCTDCGYSLPKDKLDGQCPECGRLFRLEEERAIWKKAGANNCEPWPEK